MKYYRYRNPSEFNVSVCGYALLNPGWTHMKRCLENDSVLILGKKNTTLIMSDDCVLEIKPGRAVLLPASELHYGIEKISEQCGYYWLHFSTGILPEQVEEKDASVIISDSRVAYDILRDSFLLPQQMDLEDCNIAEELFEKVLSSFQDKKFSVFSVNLCAMNLIDCIFRQCFPKNNLLPSDGNNLIHRMVQCIHEELFNPDLSIKYISSVLNLNADYAGRVFKRYMKTSCGNYISKKRIEQACLYLRNSRDSIEDIYSCCGYSSRRQFYDDFKFCTGTTPARYRRQFSFVLFNVN